MQKIIFQAIFTFLSKIFLLCYNYNIYTEAFLTTSDNKIIATVIGADKVGIIADVAAVLAECGVNIEDIKQSVIQNCFVMFMLVNSEKSELSFKEIKDKLTSTGERLKMEIWVQKKQIFDKMHSV